MDKSSTSTILQSTSIETIKQSVSDQLKTDMLANWALASEIRPDLELARQALSARLFYSGQIPPALKQMIAMALSKQNNCDYCSILHTKVLEKIGIPEDVIENSVSQVDMLQIPPTYRSILKFTLKASKAPLDITDDDFEVLREQGLTDEEILEITMVVAYLDLVNTWTQVPPIPPRSE